jgi:DNA-binding LytR/AlgR family response regulator
MKSLIIEDEPLVAKDLSKLIREIDPSIEIIAQLESLDACRKYFASNASPDLLFMDIQLSDGVSFDLFQTVKIDCPIIFTTAYNEYAIRAFKVNGIDYLLKPIDKAELSIAIARFHKLKESARQDLQQQMQTLFQQIANPGEKPIYKERFCTFRKIISCHQPKSGCMLPQGFIDLSRHRRQQSIHHRLQYHGRIGRTA